MLTSSNAPRVAEPSLLQSLIPIAFLIGMLASSVYLFGDSSSGGANQIALVLSAAVAAVIGPSTAIRGPRSNGGSFTAFRCRSVRC